MLKKAIQVPEAVAHYSVGSVVFVVSLLVLGVRAHREERAALRPFGPASRM